MNIFEIYTCMYVSLYIHNKYKQYTHALCKQTLLFWMRLITINHLKALNYIHRPTYESILKHILN